MIRFSYNLDQSKPLAEFSILIIYFKKQTALCKTVSTFLLRLWAEVDVACL